MVKKLLFTILVFSGLSWAGEDFAVKALGPFGTLNDTDNALILEDNKAQDLLNVDISANGLSVKKRKGYGLAYTMTNTTSPIRGLFTFYDSNGSENTLIFNDGKCRGSVSGAATTSIFTNGSSGATYDCADSMGYAYCVNTSRQRLNKLTGAAFASVSVPSTGTMVEVTPLRLVMAGFSDNPGRIWFSKANDFTTWAVGGAATDPVYFTITSPGQSITHIVYAFNRLVWFKSNSFGYIIEGVESNQTDWVVKTVSNLVGTRDNTSVYWNGILYFRGQDSHYYAFDGSNLSKISDDIKTFVGRTKAGSSNSFNETSKADWEAGTVSTATYLTTSDVAGQISLSTAEAIGSFTDTTQANFVAGTLSNVNPYTTSGRIILSTTVYTMHENSGSGSSYTFYTSSIASIGQSFYPSTSGVLSKVAFYCKRTGSPGNATLTIRGITPPKSFGTIFLTQTVSFNTASTSGALFWITLDSGVPLTANTSYWMVLSQFGNASNNIRYQYWADGGSNYDGYLYASYPVDFGSSQQYQWTHQTTGYYYNTPGTIVSRNFDVGFTTSDWKWEWSNLASSATRNTGGTITYETQTSSAGAMTWTTLAAVSTGSAPSSISQRYVRYKITMETTNTAYSPKVDDLTISMTSRKRPTAIYYSSVHDTSNASSWGTLDITQADNGGSLTYYVRSSTQNTFAETASTPTWATVVDGAIPTCQVGDYTQFKMTFSVDKSTDNPIVYDATLNWTEGGSTDRVAAMYNDDNIWWAVTYGTATANNRVLVRDLINNGWTIYDLQSTAFCKINQKPYFGSSSAGYVYLYGDVDADNGAAINSYWKSKDFFGASPFTELELSNISLTAKQVALSTLTVTYQLDGETEYSYNMGLEDSSTQFLYKNKNLPAGRTGTTFNIKFGNNALDQFWEVFGGQAGYRPKSWRPTP